MTEIRADFPMFTPGTRSARVDMQAVRAAGGALEEDRRNLEIARLLTRHGITMVVGTASVQPPEGEYLAAAALP